MMRKDEALKSRGNMSLKKTIYVEGCLDYNLIKDFCLSKFNKKVTVIEINNFIDDSHLSVQERKISKTKIIDLILELNKDSTINHSYLGIVDLDYDFIIPRESISNLIYTDYNCVESYLLDYSLIDYIQQEYKEQSGFTINEYEQMKTNFKEFSFYFYFQLSNFSTLEPTELVNFKHISLNNCPWVSGIQIDLNKLIQLKVKSPTSLIPKFLEFKSNFEVSFFSYSDTLILHGKYLLRFIIGYIKTISSSLSKLGEKCIINILKDKFLLFNKHKNYQLFQDIIQFIE